MNKAELKACPFCDGRPEMDCMRGYRAMADGRMGSGVVIYCTRCDCEMMLCREDLPECDTDELIEMLASQWNKRAGDRQPAVPETESVKALASAICSADATPRFRKAYLECLDDMGAITRLEPLYAFGEGMERENQDLRQQMVGQRREIEHQKARVLAWERVASPYPPNIPSSATPQAGRDPRKRNGGEQ